ncbi:MULTISPECIES: YwqG family protein [Paenibacillus]|uniref:DUF1963 domain-containing protein n=1 Tax=Paenibacillus albilobatus TaxID=2716884 RepID=A0A920C8L2_9BACL|nr:MULTISPECIES: DUF1963 domain-containing protein [Paenibacillus]GIO30055.1 hypothetical protein J2TS6_11960 [Paenibacillus albilobatus]
MQFLDGDNRWTPEFLDYLEKTAKPSVRLKLSKETVRLTDSKVGGTPWLPPQSPWPRDEDGNDYLFIAQINWAQLPRLEGFPARGLTSFFVKQDDTFGLFDQSYRILHVEEAAELEDIDPYRPEDPDLYSPVLGGPYKLTGNLEKQYIPPVDRGSGTLDLPVFDRDKTAYSKYWDLADSSGSRIGGYPYFAQEDPRPEGDWELLLQLDIEGDDKQYYVSWGDSGVGNFFIRREDLKRLDFSNVFYTWDCL